MNSIVVLTSHDLSAADRCRLNGYVEKVLKNLATPTMRCCSSYAICSIITTRARSRSRTINNTRLCTTMPKILLVEDNEMNRDMLSRRLSAVVTTSWWPSMAERRGYGAARPPDLILMDMSLPVLDGWEATRQLKARSHGRDSRDRAHRARHGGRPREGDGSRLRRLRHQTDRVPAAARKDRGALERAGFQRGPA